MSDDNPYKPPRVAEEGPLETDGPTLKDRLIWSVAHAVSAAALSFAALISSGVLLLQLHIAPTMSPEIAEVFLPSLYFTVGIAALAGAVLGVWRPEPVGLAHALIAPIFSEGFFLAYSYSSLGFAELGPLYLLSIFLKGAIIAAGLTRAAAAHSQPKTEH
jgi:hypothetical protein